MRSRFQSVTLAGLILCLSACGQSPDLLQSWQHSEGSYAAQFSEDGRWLLSAGTDSEARLWDVQGRTVQYDWHSQQSEFSGSQLAMISRNSQVAATVEYDTIMLWRIATGEPLNRIQMPYRIRAVALSPDAGFLLISLANRTAVYFDVAANRVVHQFEHGGDAQRPDLMYIILSVAISPDGRMALTGGDDWTAQLWDLQTGEQLQRWAHGNNVNLVGFDPQGQFALTAAENDQTHVWSVTSGRRQATLRLSVWPTKLAEPNWSSFKYTTTAVGFSSDSRYLMTGHANERVCLWQMPSAQKAACWRWPRQQTLKPGNVLQSIHISTDNRLSAAAGDGWVHQWQGQP